MNEELKKRIDTMMPILNERQLRQYLGAEAQSIGFGGIELISKISGKSRNTIVAGIKDNKSSEDFKGRVRRPGGGRKKITVKNPIIKEEVEAIVSSDTYGNPENILVYTTKSLRKIESILKEKNINVSHDTIADILKDLGYSLQLNQKLEQVGKNHPDRNKQFEFINQKIREFIEAGNPVISTDTKKKEILGNNKNDGQEYRKVKNPRAVMDHDFLTELGKVVPYGVYDVNKNEGFVNLGISADTAEFAIESISRWWQTLGKNTYPNATELYINCDGGGSNGSRVRLWKYQLQQLANITGLKIHVSHFPPGTSKWNKIEHKMFCYISKSWRGQPLISVETTVNLISSTTTTKGLKIKCERDDKHYELGIKVSDEEFNKINIKKEDICPEWNYIISPNN
jgi:transposase